MMNLLTDVETQGSVTMLAGAIERTLGDGADGEAMAQAANYSRFP
jgi:hypothetical protein